MNLNSDLDSTFIYSFKSFFRLDQKIAQVRDGLVFFFFFCYLSSSHVILV